MAPRLEELHPPLDRRGARPASRGVRPQRRGHSARTRDDRAGRQHAKPAITERRPPPAADLGIILLIVFTASALTIVALVVVVAAIGSWWTLIPIMVVDFAVTAAVLFTVAKLLEDRFDPARQTALSSFATPTILGELKRYFRDYGWSVRVPRSLQERALRVEQATEALWRAQGRAPTPVEVAEHTQITVEQVLEARQAYGAHWAISLDPTGDEQVGAPADSLAIDEPGFLVAEDAATAERLMRVLTDHEREILRLRFEEDLHRTEIAERVGISPTQVARVLRRSIEALHETTTRPPNRVATTGGPCGVRSLDARRAV